MSTEKKKRPTPERWEQARIQWEADPLLTFEAMAADLGVSRVAVSKHAKREGWERAVALPNVARRAQFKADMREAAKLPPEVTGQVTQQVAGESTKKAVRELAEDIRADVIERHRADWAEHRTHYKTGDIAADFDLGKSAKISAEMLTLRQKAERAAYGLDEQATVELELKNPWGRYQDGGA